jgi:hypothetical protein
LGKKVYHCHIQGRDEAPLKRRSPATKENKVKTQKAVIFMLNAKKN